MKYKTLLDYSYPIMVAYAVIFSIMVVVSLSGIK